MQYLIVQIWALLAAAAAVGLFIGWLIRGGSLGARLRDLRRQLREAENETVRQRDEAARLAAELQRVSPGDAISTVTVERLQEQLAEAQAVADREAAGADALRERIAVLENAAGSEDDADSGMRDRVAALEEENARLQDALGAARADSAAPVVDPEETEALRTRIAQLTARLADAEPAAAELADARRELADLRAAPAAADTGDADDAAALRVRLAALEDGDEAAYLEGDERRRGHWLAARNRWLERKLQQLQGGEPLAPSALEAEAIELRARVAELEAGGAAPAMDEETAGDLAELARLRWRNRYLVSRVSYLESRAQTAVADGDATDAGAGADIERLRARNAELEETLRGGAGGSAMQEEIERLRSRVVELESAGPTDETASTEENETYSLEWRNRYLASRVRYLERRLEDAAAAPTEPETDGDAGRDDELERLRSQIAALQAQAEEAPRLRARIAEMQGDNAGGASEGEAEPLRARVRELERALDEARSGRGPRHEGDYALEWRNRYLTSRVKYLEERLAESRRVVTGGEGDVA